MENSENHNESLGGQNKRKYHFQQTSDVENSDRHLYPESDFYVVHKDQFKSFIQYITGNQSNASWPPVPVEVSSPVPPSQALYNALPGHTLHPIIGPPLVDNSQSNVVECPMSTSMINFQDSMRMNIGNLGGNQFQPYFPQSQVFNNTSIQYHPIIQSQEHFLPLNGSSQFVNGFPSTQITNVSNHSMSLNATNPTFHVNTNDQLVNGFPSSSKSPAKETRLHKIRPPPLSIVRPTIPVMVPAPIPPSQAPYSAVSGHPVDNSQTNVSNPPVSMNASDPTFHVNDNNNVVNGFTSSQTNDILSPTSEFMLPSPTSNMNFLSPKSPYRPLLSPNLFSSPSSPEYPFYSLLIPDPPSPLSSSLFPFTTSPNRPDSQ